MQIFKRRDEVQGFPDTHITDVHKLQQSIGFLSPLILFCFLVWDHIFMVPGPTPIWCFCIWRTSNCRGPVQNSGPHMMFKACVPVLGPALDWLCRHKLKQLGLTLGTWVGAVRLPRSALSASEEAAWSPGRLELLDALLQVSLCWEVPG